MYLEDKNDTMFDLDVNIVPIQPPIDYALRIYNNTLIHVLLKSVNKPNENLIRSEFDALDGEDPHAIKTVLQSLKDRLGKMTFSAVVTAFDRFRESAGKNSENFKVVQELKEVGGSDLFWVAALVVRTSPTCKAKMLDKFGLQTAVTKSEMKVAISEFESKTQVPRSA
ncbi:hypothetical protein MOUN0_F04082 [Monosporozyma unispora]